MCASWEMKSDGDHDDPWVIPCPSYHFISIWKEEEINYIGNSAFHKDIDLNIIHIAKDDFSLVSNKKKMKNKNKSQNCISTEARITKSNASLKINSYE